MKRQLVSLMMLISLSGISAGKINDLPRQKRPDQIYIQVEAQKRLYNGGNVKYAPYAPFKTRTVGLLVNYKAPGKLPALSKYGGWLEHKVEATGFFHVIKIGERWWGVDPEGYLYINVALNSISMGKSDRNQKAANARFGSPQIWISKTLEILEENGFNCAGSWSDTESIIEANHRSAPGKLYGTGGREIFLGCFKSD